MSEADEVRQCGLNASGSGRSWGLIRAQCHISKGRKPLSVLHRVLSIGLVYSRFVRHYCRYVRYCPSISGDRQPSRVGEVSRSECSVMTDCQPLLWRVQQTDCDKRRRFIFATDVSYTKLESGFWLLKLKQFLRKPFALFKSFSCILFLISYKIVYRYYSIPDSMSRSSIVSPTLSSFTALAA
jgi:hypothetical protein